MASLNFNARQVAPSTGRDPLPGGWYTANIVKSEVQPTKTGNGLRLNLEYSVLAPDWARGRKFFVGLNIKHEKAQVQEIGLSDLSAIAHAVNVLDVAESSQLHGIPHHVRLKVRKQDGYDDANDATAWKPAHEQVQYATNASGAGAGGVPAAGAGFAAPQTPAGFGQPQQQFQQTQQPAFNQQAQQQGNFNAQGVGFAQSNMTNGNASSGVGAQQVSYNQQQHVQQAQQPWEQPQQVQQQQNVTQHASNAVADQQYVGQMQQQSAPVQRAPAEAEQAAPWAQ